ncbi:hypothetical protein WN73_14315 [Bradyrhizobium sp. CCBAU 45394]|nr:hypothetical protein [Bradyrhizobium sp. CCBAU 45394]MDA9537329.1 hypothetical protein [Bradyrhizobium sp. CCBAU 21362]
MQMQRRIPFYTVNYLIGGYALTIDLRHIRPKSVAAARRLPHRLAQLPAAGAKLRILALAQKTASVQDNRSLYAQ